MSNVFALLGDISTLQAGFGFPPSLQGRTNGQYPFAKVGDISRGGRSESSVLSKADHYVDAVDVAALRAKIVPPGSVLFAKIGEAIRQNHRVVAGCEMLIDNNAMAAIPNARVDSRFLYHFLKTVDFYCLAPATTVPALRKSDLEKLQVPLPPLPQQRRIAAILDQADALRAKRREALAQLDSLTQSIFIEMFGDPRQLPLSWPSGPLKALGRVITGRTPPSSKEGMFGGAVPFITPGDLESDQPAKRTLTEEGVGEVNPVRAGAALVCCIGTIGKMGMADVRSAFNQQINAVDWYEIVDDAYGLAALRFLRSQLAAQAASTTVPILNKSAFEKFEIQVPPLALQRTFAARIQAVDSLKTTHRAALAELDALFASLQHRAFAGQLS